LLLQHAEISKRWSSHGSVEATAVPLMKMGINRRDRGLVLANGTNSCVFEEADRRFGLHDRHVTWRDIWHRLPFRAPT